jgi:tRNA (guanine-N7-)-methyltransferase
MGPSSPDAGTVRAARQVDTHEAATLHRAVRSFVRREGRLTRAQARALETLLPRYAVPPAGAFDPQTVFQRRAPLYLEVGCGNGDCITALAAHHPDRDYLGVEVHRPGLGHLLLAAADAGLRNLRVCDEDVLSLLPRLPAGALSGAYVFFPDPWPKLRHHKRRLLQAPFFTEMRRCLARHARLYLATDSAAYATHIVALVSILPGWENLAGEGRAAPRPKFRPLTRFEARGLAAGHTVQDFVLSRRD